MPNRILREGILTSRAVSALSDDAQLFYRALMSVVDDYGRFEVDLDVLRAKCFPLQMERWSIFRIEDALVECNETTCSDGFRLVSIYSIAESDKHYMQIHSFGQRIRTQGQGENKKPVPSKYPEPTVADARGVSRASSGGWRRSSASSGEVPRVAADGGESPRSAAQSLSYSESYTYSEAKTQTQTVALDSALSVARRQSSAIDDPEAVSDGFHDWWILWSDSRGTAYRTQAGHAWTSVAKKRLKKDIFECTGSYLDSSMVIDGKGFNPHNFLFEQARDEFRARWPPRVRQSTANQVRAENVIKGLEAIDQIKGRA